MTRLLMRLILLNEQMLYSGEQTFTMEFVCACHYNVAHSKCLKASHLCREWWSSIRGHSMWLSHRNFIFDYLFLVKFNSIHLCMYLPNPISICNFSIVNKKFFFLFSSFTQFQIWHWILLAYRYEHKRSIFTTPTWKQVCWANSQNIST